MSSAKDPSKLDQHLGFTPGFLSDSPELIAWRAVNERTACVLEVGGFRPTGDVTSSHIGLSPLMAEGEAWPMDAAGQPMQFIAQLNFQQAPWVPEALRDLAMLQFFVGEQFIESGSKAGTWAVITRTHLNGLTPRAQPPFREQPWVGQGVEARWQSPQSDYPCYDDDGMRLPEGMAESPDEAHGECLPGTKIGGWATSIQHGVQFFPYTEDEQGNWQPSPNEPPYVLQIDSEGKAGLHWVDGGVVHLGRHPKTSAWAASCQFY